MDYSVQFSSVQLLSHVRLFATPWIAACQASLSITNSRSLPKLMSIKSVMPSSHLILCHPLLLLPPVPPNIRVFSSESTLRMRWPKYWRFSFMGYYLLFKKLLLRNATELMQIYIIEHRRCLFTVKAEQALLGWVSPLWVVTSVSLRAMENDCLILIWTIRLCVKLEEDWLWMTKEKQWRISLKFLAWAE